MASAPKALDVWYVTANTVYRGVPYQVVADWVREGRLGAADQLRPAGSGDRDWRTVGTWELFADYLPGSGTAPGAEGGEVELPEPVEPESHGRKVREAEDDEVDMIPLIDISMVLLVFFVIVSATGALSPVDVPDMKHAGTLTNDPNAITINIQKASEEDVYYALRVGKTAPRPEYARLGSPEDALKALDALLGEATQPPHVQVACEKALPSKRVVEMQLELKKRFDKRLIQSFDATVNEAPPG
ncbi:ExbD/TolR family protein [Urbifossiella limnaea]|uniref:Biopolymer transport protein ExbD/TolR n=1 Tax=Urbifossiella limnaea TaxID=2528023 RepID=A0A517XTA7_9BACT|nr:biopolymer transporter ExbD [Urbifossiella limnaea]QDU20725.1 Biopolymer transport protein ExbD/TolR [Urbifossiella limnaea]